MERLERAPRSLRKDAEEEEEVGGHYSKGNHGDDM